MKISKMVGFVAVLVLLLMGCQSSGSYTQSLEHAAAIDREVDTALRNLHENHPGSEALASKAKGVLVFPRVVKAGFIGGIQYGNKGALRVDGRSVGYYNIVAGSYGLQAGIQAFSYAMFFMTDSALQRLQSGAGFEIGVGPSVVVVDAGKAAALTTTTLRADVYSFIFDQRGLMAGIGLQGSKITKIHP